MDILKWVPCGCIQPGHNCKHFHLVRGSIVQACGLRAALTGMVPVILQMKTLGLRETGNAPITQQAAKPAF